MVQDVTWLRCVAMPLSKPPTSSTQRHKMPQSFSIDGQPSPPDRRGQSCRPSLDKAQKWRNPQIERAQAHDGIRAYVLAKRSGPSEVGFEVCRRLGVRLDLERTVPCLLPLATMTEQVQFISFPRHSVADNLIILYYSLSNTASRAGRQAVNVLSDSEPLASRSARCSKQKA